MTKPLGVGIIGCGLIGQKRARALGPARLVACVDRVLERAETLARAMPGASATSDYRAILARSDVDVVIVATTNDLLAPITQAALEAGKHVLVEKPASRNVKELDAVISTAERSGRLVRVGFNHRYHPALRKARELYDAGALGDCLARCVSAWERQRRLKNTSAPRATAT